MKKAIGGVETVELNSQFSSILFSVFFDQISVIMGVN
jgi:hypothetical protein